MKILFDFACLLVIFPGSYAAVKSPKVAIIGGGIVGALSAHYLQEVLNDEIDITIDIYEHNEPDKITPDAILVHSKDVYINNLIQAKIFPAAENLSGTNNYSNNHYYMSYNGRKKFINKLDIKLLHNKDSTSYRNLSKFLSKSLKDFQNVYKIQEENKSFEKVADLLKKIHPNFLNYLSQTTAQLLLDDRINISRDEYMKNFLEAVLFRKYRKNLNAHAFAGLESFWSSELTGDLKLITYNYSEVLKKLLFKSNGSGAEKVRFLPWKVKFLERKYNRNIVNYIDERGRTQKSGYYDFLIIEDNDDVEKIEFFGFKNFNNLCQKSRLYATFIEGTLKKSNLEKYLENGATVLDTKEGKVVDQYKGAWRIISQSKTKNADVGAILKPGYKICENNEEVKITPKLNDFACVLKANFLFTESVYSLYAIDWAAPSSEIIAIGVKNVALLIKEKIIFE